MKSVLGKALVRVLLGLLVELSAAAAGVEIFVAASSAPEFGWSPSFDGIPPDYAVNALYALENGLSNYGDPASPTYYSQQSTFAPGDLMSSSGFKSWKGVANPTGLFTNEYGNLLHFGLHIRAQGPTFKVANLTFRYTSVDNFTGPGQGQYPLGELGFAGDFGSWAGWGVYGTGRKADGTPATSINDDLVEFSYVGLGDSFMAFVPHDGPTPQEALDNLASSILGPETNAHNVTSISCEYSLLASDGQTYSGSATAYRAPGPSPRIRFGACVSWRDGVLTGSIENVLGRSVTLLASTNLADWFTVTNLPGTNDTLYFQDSSATNGWRFYRAESP
jgi:hypothetical protein